MGTSLPPKLYKYQPFNAQTLANLKNRLWYFAPPAVFNDPFDCRYDLRRQRPSSEELEWLREAAKRQAAAGDNELQELLRKGPERLSGLLDREFAALRSSLFEQFENRGVCCFSGRKDSLLMWAHYADGHRGFCLEFDTSSVHFERIHPVRYHDESPAISPARLLTGDASGAFEAVLCSKPSDWAYEQEWRAFHEKAGTEYCYGTDTLSAIYFGSQMKYVHLELLSLVVRGSQTRLIEAKLENGSYALTFAEFSYTPHPEAGGGSA